MVTLTITGFTSLSHNGPPFISCDSISSISLASNPVSMLGQNVWKLITIICEKKYVTNELEVQYITTIDQVAVMFTKGLFPSRFRFLSPSSWSSTCGSGINVGKNQTSHCNSIKSNISIPLLSPSKYIIIKCNYRPLNS